MATIQIPVLFDMSGDTIVFGEEASGDFVSSHLDFVLDMTTEANGISLNAADISSAILVGDQETGDSIFYSGGSSGSVGVDNLCNRIAKAITRGKLIHLPKSGNTSNSGIPMGGRANLYDLNGVYTENGNNDKYAIKYFTSIAPIGDEQMLGQAMARVASIHLVGSPLSAGIFQDKNSVQTQLETASAQTFNSGNTAFYNALAVQLSKVLGGSKSSAPMKNGTSIIATGDSLASQIYHESFDNEDVTFHANADIVYVDGIGGSGKAMSTIGQSPAGFQWVQKVSDGSLPSNVRAVSFHIKFVGSQFIFDNGWNDGRALFFSQFKLKFKNGSATSGDPSGSGYLPTGTQPTIWYDGAKTMYSNITNSAIGALVLNGDGTDIHNNSMNDGNWHHFYIEYPDGETLPDEFSWLANKNGDGASQGSIDDLRYFNAALTPTQIQILGAGGAGTVATSTYPLDASGTSVPALKSIYEQLMNVPGRSQIMQTRDVSGVVDNSNVTLAGGFPFISGDKLVVYLRPKINFATQTFPEQHSNAIVGFSDKLIFNIPVYNIADSTGSITSQTYSQSSTQDNTLFNFEQAMDGTGVAGTEYFTSAGGTYNNTTGVHTGAGQTTNVDGSTTLDGEWGQVDIGVSTFVKELSLTANNAYNDRSPREFKLLGSTDGTNWKTLIHETEAGPWVDNTSQTFENLVAKPYRYYRYVVIKCYNAVNGGNIDGRTSLGHFNLKGSLDTEAFIQVGGKAGEPGFQPIAQAVQDISGLITNFTATAQNIQDAFPGNATTGHEAESLKWGWMGSANSDTLSLDTTDINDTGTIDLHIWKITITL